MNSIRVACRLCACAIVAASMPVMSVDAAFLEGEVMDVQLFHRTTAQSDSASVVSGDFVVGDGVELPGFGFRTNPSLPALVDIDISDTQVSITLIIDQPSAFQEVFRILDSNLSIGPFQAININPVTNWAGFNSFRLGGSSSEAIFVDVSQLSGLQGQQILLDIVPEPTGAGLLAAALPALAAVRRRRACGARRGA